MSEKYCFYFLEQVKISKRLQINYFWQNYVLINNKKKIVVFLKSDGKYNYILNKIFLFKKSRFHLNKDETVCCSFSEQ